MSFADRPAHRARDLAESFGADPARYDRTRPRYPAGLVQRVIAASPGRRVLDVGAGTGIVARAFRDAGCEVLGVEVDERMAVFARASGVEVEVARFEDWDPAGREFDAVLAGQTWHWIDPAAGALKAAEALTAAGRLAVFWYVHQPPAQLNRAFAAVYRDVVPDTPFARGTMPGLDAYERFFAGASDGMAAAGFAPAQRWHFAWAESYTRDQWLDQVPTSGGHSALDPERLQALLAGLGAAVDAAGGAFTMHYDAVVVTALAGRPHPSVH